MAKVAFTFRLFANDETDGWNLEGTALENAPAFGVYIICEGEATHICSFEASSRADFLENRFLYTCDDDAAHEEAGELLTENGGEWTTYFGFINPTAESRRDYVSTPLRVVLDSRDYEGDAAEYAAALEKGRRGGWSHQETHALARRWSLRETAWETARETYGANHESVPVTDDGAAFERHRRRLLMQAAARTDWEARHSGARDLFGAAGVELVRQLPPA